MSKSPHLTPKLSQNPVALEAQAETNHQPCEPCPGWGKQGSQGARSEAEYVSAFANGFWLEVWFPPFLLISPLQPLSSSLIQKGALWLLVLPFVGAWQQWAELWFANGFNDLLPAPHPSPPHTHTPAWQRDVRADILRGFKLRARLQ